MTLKISSPHAASVAAESPSPITFDRGDLDDATLLKLYDAILLPRMIEERMLLLLRQGRVSKWFSGIGQEAIAVGSTTALAREDYILPLHRNLGVFTSRDIPLERLFLQWQGKRDGFTKGRDRSFHFGTKEFRIIGMISHLGAMLGVADGLALASQLAGETGISLVYSGDGGMNEGDFHEAINLAAVWDLPVIFLVENNGYALSTPTRDQYRCGRISDRAIGYGIEGITIDGNNVLDVYRTIRDLAASIRTNPRPVLIEAITFRMRGHEEASGVAYVPPELFQQWAPLDPVSGYQRYLLELGVLTEERIVETRARFDRRIGEAVDAMFAAPEIAPSVEEELADVHAPAPGPIAPAGPASERRFVDAVSDGLRQGMLRDPRLVIMGQDVAEYGGVFKVTEGFLDEFGRDRVRNTPLCESAVLGAALGLAIEDRASVVEMQFADFVSNGFNQIVNNLAKTHYRWGVPVNVTVRMPTGAGVGAGPFHSQSTESWFTHVPGLKVLYPSTPADAKGLMAAALVDPNPVLFFEHKLLYRSIKGMVPEGYYTLPIGEAAVARQGTDVTIVTYGAGVHWALATAAEMPEASIEIIDLRTLLPWDRRTVFASVEKTGRCLVLSEDTHTGSFAAEIAATIAEERFQALDAPVARVCSLDTPVPFNRGLEEQFLAKRRLRERLAVLLAY
jgi:2-oxoisovalerate dehydrogenase E1 component